MSRTEALSYREMCLKFRVKRRTEHLLDIIREVESEIEPFHAMLDASFFGSLLLECDLLAKKVPGGTSYSQRNIIRNWT